MSLSRKIADAVAERSGVGTGPGPLSVEDGPYGLTLEAAIATPVGVSCDAIAFERSGTPAAGLETVRGWSERLASRVTYLLEPLVIHETDAEQAVVELRSRTPDRREGRRSYYEVRLYPEGRLRLQRVAYDEATRRREAAPCRLTTETLERLAEDLVGCTQ